MTQSTATTIQSKVFDFDQFDFFHFETFKYGTITYNLFFFYNLGHVIEYVAINMDWCTT